MAMSGGHFGGHESGSGFSRRRRNPMADINITPMVDVMLVLLIIFMVAAPLLVSGVKVDLPDAKAKTLSQDNQPVQVTIDRTGTVYLDKLAIPATALAEKFSALRTARTDDPRVYVRADAALPYGQAMAVVSELSGAGFKKIALITEARAAKPKSR
jgi:biopolymer transport protein TolR